MASVEATCIVCQLVFCCSNCRWMHETKTHGLLYDCPMCRGNKYYCKLTELNEAFKKHIISEHIPLQCNKCNKLFENMEELVNIDACNSISELIEIDIDNKNNSKKVDENFNKLYENIANNEPTTEKYLDTKTTKTAVITPVVRKKHLVDYESSDSEEDSSPQKQKPRTPHPKVVPKTPKLKKQRSATPHVKKLLTLMKQKVVEEYEESPEDHENYDNSSINKTTPSRNVADEIPKEMTTPNSHIQHLIKLAQAVTTSTPTHPVACGWSMFPDQGADSPLSEIENAESPAQSLVEQSKTEGENQQPKLKSIIVTGSRLKLGSQDSSEKQVTFQDSVNNNNDSSATKIKKVKFAENTIFEPEPKLKRVFRKPKRMLTPGPQKPRYCFNPRFQALINRFENQGITPARTPLNTKREVILETTPPVGEPSNMPARAINFKEESPIVDVNMSKESTDLFKTCVDSSVETSGVNNAISMFTSNIAGSLQNCLSSVLRTTEEETEIQFKFVITKKKVTIKKSADNDKANIDSGNRMELEDGNKENIWFTVAKAVKNVFWSDQGNNLTTPFRSRDSNDTNSSSASKRKCEEMSDSDLSPLNHKRYKYEGKIRGRPPLRRARTFVAGLRTSQSAEHDNLISKMVTAEEINQSF